MAAKAAGTGKDYAAKRSSDATPEPQPAVAGNVDPTIAIPGATFMVHQHHATRLHFDLRLEMLNGTTPVLVSWAVPKNLPQEKGRRHLAVHVEDHPFDYGSFSGTIPKGNYGAGEVRIFDSGTYEVLEQEPQKLTIRLQGERLKGVWHMIQTKREPDKDDWLVMLRELERDEPDPLTVIEPMMATLVADAFDDEGWVFEPKWDGVRAIATCVDETVLVSRNLRNISASYPELAKLHQQLVCFEAVLDGEIVAMSKGRPSFEQLQSRINLANPKDIERATKEVPVSFVAFDLLYLDGKSLVTRPLEERKELLEQTVIPNDYIEVSPYVEGEGAALFDAARARNLEGIVAKKLGGPYRPSKRSKEWLKIKTIYDADVVIGGWSRGEGSRSGRFGSLLVGAYDEGSLRFVGAVGTGFSDKSLTEMLTAMQALASDDNPFDSDPRKDKSRWGKPIKDPQWIAPELVARVEFRELTSAGRLRAPSFKGLRNDKDPGDCVFSDLAPRGSGDRQEGHDRLDDRQEKDGRPSA
jgi:bifunctional non-homologous end joining protein LigD